MNRYLYTIAYILFNGASVLAINKVGNQIPVALMILLGSGYALLFFHLINIHQTKKMYRKVWQHKVLYSQTIVVFLLMWCVCFILPVYYTPALLMFFATAWPSFFGASTLYLTERKRSSLYLALGIAVVIMGYYLALFSVYPLLRYGLMVLGTTIAGITMFLYSNLSYRMNQAGFAPSEILAVRFILLFLVPLFWCIKTHEIALINVHMLWLTALLSLLSLIIPVYCSQISIQKIGPNIHTIAMGVTPFVAFLFELIGLRHQHAISVDGIFATALVLTILLTKGVFSYATRQRLKKV
ncbi:MAG: hypothetical protein A3F17_05075 [Gammaproteobacteria bacterium RIFCSPHIGHO2_12_FULL_41_15]|nr:MAG: hypothetical protein A3F17_05075 [Gammaproteobacteria bacterium RIFCSPHIGHO2_12_FULL_41_15]